MHQEINILTKYFIAAIICFFLQLIPIVGVICMIFGSSLWIGLIIHIALIHVSYRVFTKMSAPKWLLLPIGYYIGGLLLHLASYTEAKKEADTIETQNNSIHVNIEPPLSFIVDGNSYYEYDRIMKKYRIDSIYIKRKDYKDNYTRLTYTKGEECLMITGDFFSSKPSQPFRSTADLFSGYHGEDKTKQCIVGNKIPRPDLPRYRIEINNFTDKGQKNLLFSVKGTSFTIIDEKERQKIGKIQVADFQSFSMVPFVIAGCFLNSGSARTECEISLYKSPFIVPAGYDPAVAGHFYNTEDLCRDLFAKKYGFSVRQPND